MHHLKILKITTIKIKKIKIKKHSKEMICKTKVFMQIENKMLKKETRNGGYSVIFCDGH